MSLYAAGAVINAKIKPLNMRSYRIFNIVIPVVVFAATYYILQRFL